MIKLIVLTALNILSSNAFGLMVPNQECVLNVHQSAWDNLKKVVVMPGDGRYGIDDGAEIVGLSKDEASRISRATGNIVCRDPVTLALTGGTGTVFEKNDQIITASHVLLDGDKLRTDCYFLRKTDPPVWRRLLIQSKRTIFGSLRFDSEASVDFALVQLDQPLNDTNPVKILKNPNKLARTDTVIMVSAGMLRMKREVKDNEAIVQKCTIKHIDPLRPDLSRLMHTDCSSTKRASGSMSYIIDTDGQLYGAGIAISAADEAFDGKPYDYFTRNTSTSVVFDDVLRSKLKLKAGSP